MWFLDLFRKGSHNLSFRIMNHHSKTCLIRFSKHSSIKISLHHTWAWRTPLPCLDFFAYYSLLWLQIFEALDVILCIPRNSIQRKNALLKARLVPMVLDWPRYGCKQRYRMLPWLHQSDQLWEGTRCYCRPVHPTKLCCPHLLNLFIALYSM